MIAASAVYLVRNIACKRRSRSEEAPAATTPPGLEQRLGEIERRLTDTQDVMIALSEKMDRWESEAAKDDIATHTPTENP